MELTYEQAMTAIDALSIAEDCAKRSAAGYEDPNKWCASKRQRAAARDLAASYRQDAEEYAALRAVLEASNG